MEPNIYHGSFPFELEGAEISSAGAGALDGGSVKWVVPFPEWKTALADEGITKGAAYAPISGFWVRDITVRPEGDLATADIVLEGLLDEDTKRLRRISAFGEIVSVGPIEKVILVDDGEGDDPEGGTATAKRRVPKVDSNGDIQYKTITTPTGAADRWNINDPGITVIDTYYATSLPATNVIGTGLSPTTAPTPPPYQWSGYGEPLRYNHPAGWVLANREPEQLYGTLGGAGLYRVTDTFEFYFSAIPD